MTERSRTPLIIGFLLGGMVLLGLSMFKHYVNTKPAEQLPTLRPIEIAVQASDSPFVRFVTDGDLKLHHDGWMAGNLHPHIKLGGVDLMAGPTDIRVVNADTFAWRIPSQPPGDHPILMFWADMRHAPVGDSVAATLRIR